MTSDLKVVANRHNSQSSTGPVTISGKENASRNAMRHGLLSARLFVEGEDPAEFQALNDELVTSLRPAGTIEHALVERVAVAIWRQRRLIEAEAAMITLARQPKSIAKKVSKELDREYSKAVKLEELMPFDQEQIEFCQRTLAEIEALETIDLRSIAGLAPTVHRQLLTDAEDETLEVFLADHKGGLTSYIAELMLWCRKELAEAEARPYLLAIAEQVRSRGLVLAEETLELLSRYQTTLDNQLYKALRALREAQEWRFKTVEPLPGVGEPSIVEQAA